VNKEPGVERNRVAHDRVRVPACAQFALEQVDLMGAREHVRRTEAGDSSANYRYTHNRCSSTCEDWLTVSEVPVPVAAPLKASVGTVRPRTSRISQVVTLIAVIVPPLGILVAAGVLWNVAFHPVDVAIMVAMYVVCAFGITIGFHRYFTHRSFEASAPVKATLAILGCMTMQGPLTQWVTDHRKHHAFSDKEGDPHSPHAGHGDGVRETLKGFVHAHVGWMFTNLGMEQGRLYGKDLYDDKLIRAIDRMYLLWVVATLGIPFAIGYALDGWAGGVEGLIWGGLVRIFLYQHATFSVNSICHMWGRRDYEVRDESRNNWVVAVLVFGEGWHNNHHAFPASARHGLHRFQIDISWWIIRGLEKLRLVSNVRLPTKDQMARRRAVQPAKSPS
jgi:stearoyl-CoA desaturase (Delta-9 desaturase)